MAARARPPEASAAGADTMTTINVLAGRASGPDPSVELGMAKPFLPGTPGI